MGTRYLPTRQDAERYRGLRAAARELNERLLKTIPTRAYEEVGDAIGMRRKGILVFDTKEMADVLADCCLFDWYEDRKNLVQRYAETHPPKPETAEGFVLSAYLGAKYRILVTGEAVPDAGIYCRDARTGEELFLMDFGLARTLGNGGVGLATRTIPLGEYWMTGGTALPITSPDDVERAMKRVKVRDIPGLEGPGGGVLFIVRACLAAGAAKHVVFEGTGRDERPGDAGPATHVAQTPARAALARI